MLLLVCLLVMLQAADCQGDDGHHNSLFLPEAAEAQSGHDGSPAHRYGMVVQACACCRCRSSLFTTATALLLQLLQDSAGCVPHVLC
jgi:hypothetical protein